MRLVHGGQLGVGPLKGGADTNTQMGLDWPLVRVSSEWKQCPPGCRGIQQGKPSVPITPPEVMVLTSSGYRQAVAQDVAPGPARAGRLRGPKEKPQ